uniref:Uncharacterized protein n=1 Tax=Tanacetum cinerariifolium TaxID=118510 RepID=A0A6L2L064_TANCI|nr:hypothetical protein [Tanacetum cinerariifolium]
MLYLRLPLSLAREVSSRVQGGGSVAGSWFAAGSEMLKRWLGDPNRQIYAGKTRGGPRVVDLAYYNYCIQGNKDDNFDFDADLREIEYFLNQDPSTYSSPTTNIDIIDPILERFIDEPALIYSSPLGDDNNDFFDFMSDNKEWKKLFDSTLPEESSKSSEIATLISSLFENEDKVFNTGILILGGTQILYNEPKDKNLKVNYSTEAFLILEERNFLSISSNQELFFHLELSVIETLLSCSSENEEKVFNPGIPILKGVHSFTLGLSHRTYETFKIVIVHQNILNEGLMKIFLFFCFCPKDKGIRGESS